MMYDSISAGAERELHDPNSPYYLGRPSAFATVQNYLNGSALNTNYFGADKASYLAQPKYDTVQLLTNNQNQHKKNTMLTRLALAAASIYGLLTLKKLHLLPKFSGKIFKLLGQGLKGVLKVVTWPLR